LALKTTLILILAIIATAVGIVAFIILNQPPVPMWLSAANAAVIGLFVFVVPLCLEWKMPGDSQ